MLSFSPITESSKLKKTILKQVLRYKYSDTIKGLVNGKTTVVYICDLNLPSIRV